MCFQGHLGKEAAGSVGSGAGQLGVSMDSGSGCWLQGWRGQLILKYWTLDSVSRARAQKAVEACPFSSCFAPVALPKPGG